MWYSMWQTPGTHATSTFHAAHSPDAALTPCPCPPLGTALCAHIISEQRRRHRWSHLSEGSAPPSALYHAFSLAGCLFLCLLAACILSGFSPQHGDTMRHLRGGDKPISEMLRGMGVVVGGNRCSPTSSSPSPLALLLRGRTELLWASSTISATMCVCIFVFMSVCVFGVC